MELKHALSALSEITGEEITTEDPYSLPSVDSADRPAGVSTFAPVVGWWL